MPQIDPEEIERLGLDPEQLEEEVAQFERNIKFLEDNWQKLLQEHPNEWVSVDEVKGVRIVEFASNPNDLTLTRPARRPEKIVASVVRLLDPSPKPFILVAA